jgi:hypothetical protein
MRCVHIIRCRRHVWTTLMIDILIHVHFELKLHEARF